MIQDLITPQTIELIKIGIFVFVGFKIFSVLLDKFNVELKLVKIDGKKKIRFVKKEVKRNEA